MVYKSIIERKLHSLSNPMQKINKKDIKIKKNKILSKIINLDYSNNKYGLKPVNDAIRT